jgi:hypothetical protein
MSVYSPGRVAGNSPQKSSYLRNSTGNIDHYEEKALHGDQTYRDRTYRDQTQRDEKIEDQTHKDQTYRNQTHRGQTDRDQTHRDQTYRDQTFRDQISGLGTSPRKLSSVNFSFYENRNEEKDKNKDLNPNPNPKDTQSPFHDIGYSRNMNRSLISSYDSNTSNTSNNSNKEATFYPNHSASPDKESFLEDREQKTFMLSNIPLESSRSGIPSTPKDKYRPFSSLSVDTFSNDSYQKSAHQNSDYQKNVSQNVSLNGSLNSSQYGSHNVYKSRENREFEKQMKEMKKKRGHLNEDDFLAYIDEFQTEIKRLQAVSPSRRIHT